MSTDHDTLTWVREENPAWDTDKARIIGGAPDGTFVLPFAEGQSLPGEWWQARDTGDRVVGYGRLDTTWGGDAEILLAVDPQRQSTGIGTFVLGRLEQEAASRGINYVHNRIRDHDRRDFVHDWLVVRGFRGPTDGDLRKRVSRSPASRGRRPPHRVEAYDASADPADRGPGHEEQGGYVNLEEHRY